MHVKATLGAWSSTTVESRKAIQTCHIVELSTTQCAAGTHRGFWSPRRRCSGAWRERSPPPLADGRPPPSGLDDIGSRAGPQPAPSGAPCKAKAHRGGRGRGGGVVDRTGRTTLPVTSAKPGTCATSCTGNSLSEWMSSGVTMLRMKGFDVESHRNQVRTAVDC